MNEDRASHLPKSFAFRLEREDAVLLERAFRASRFKTKQDMVLGLLRPAMKTIVETAKESSCRWFTLLV